MRVRIFVGVGAAVGLLLGALSCVGDSPSNPAGPDAGPDGSADAGTDTNGSTDATDAAVAPSCDLAKPFGVAALVPGAINTPAIDDAFWLLPDQLTVFVASSRATGTYPDHLFTGTRTSLDASFGSLVPMASLNAVASGAGASPATLTGDGKTIYFGNGSTGNYDAWVATRNSTLVNFDPPSLVAAPINVNGGGAGEDFITWVSPDGSRAYLVSNRAGSNGRDIWVADRAGVGAFNAPVPLASVNSAADEDNITLTPDQLQAFLNRGGQLYYTSRATESAGFSTPVAVNELNSGASESPAWVSPDGCTLYFTSNRVEGGVGNYDIYVATRGK